MRARVLHLKAEEFLPSLPDGSVNLLLTDPPYYGITDDAWDNQWGSEREFAGWLSDLFLQALPKLSPTGSLVFFGGLGKHGSHPLFRVVTSLEDGGYTFRNWVTWRKRRAYGKSHDYLYVREEILWFSGSRVHPSARASRSTSRTRTYSLSPRSTRSISRITPSNGWETSGRT